MAVLLVGLVQLLHHVRGRDPGQAEKEQHQRILECAQS